MESATGNAVVTIYTCPSGKRALIKWATLLSEAATPGQMVMWCERSGPNKGYLIWQQAGTTKILYNTPLPCYAVLNEGETIGVFVSTAGSTTKWHALVGGIEFDV